jgi:hypothetical protein
MAKSKLVAQSNQASNERLWEFVVRSSDEVATWPSWKVSGTTTPSKVSGRSTRESDQKAAKTSGR